LACSTVLIEEQMFKNQQDQRDSTKVVDSSPNLSTYVHLCTHEVFYHPVHLEESLALSKNGLGVSLFRIGEREESGCLTSTWKLWEWADVAPEEIPPFTRVLHDPDFEGSLDSAGEHMLRRLLLSYFGHLLPMEVTAPGLIDGKRYNALLQSIRRDTDAAAAIFRDVPIVSLASELNLYPVCIAVNGKAWQCQCPGFKNHSLLIDAEKGLFYCGYCRVGGSYDDLKEFVSDPVVAKLAARELQEGKR